MYTISREDQFEAIVLSGKLTLIVACVILALKNGHISYVKKNPQKFIEDSILIAVTAALGTVFLCFTRDGKDIIRNFLFVSLFFFMYHVLREFAGYFVVLGNEKPTHEEKQRFQKNKMTIYILLLVILLVMIYAIFIALRNKSQPDFSAGIFKGLPLPVFMVLLLEALVFSAILTSGEAVVAKNHDDLGRTFIPENMGMFVFAHFILQYGGFYKKVFGH